MVPDIYKYDDFRQFLHDAYETRKKKEPEFTHRRFAEIAGVRNPGTLIQVIQGKRPLSDKVREACIQIFGLRPIAAEFFRLLVDYRQTHKSSTRESLWREIQNRRVHSSFVRINAGSVRYYSDTAYALVLSAIEASSFHGDYNRLASFIRPAMSVPKVKKCVRDLCEWNLLEQEPGGDYHVVSRFLEPPATLKDPVRLLNREWILHAADAIESVSAQERHISTAILAVSESTRNQILKRIEAMRNDVFALVQSDSPAECVMQLSIQYFPKSHLQRRTAS